MSNFEAQNIIDFIKATRFYNLSVFILRWHNSIYHIRLPKFLLVCLCKYCFILPYCIDVEKMSYNRKI